MVRDRFSCTATYRGSSPLSICDFLAEKTGLPKRRIKDALVKGAVWMRLKGRGMHRVRKAARTLKPGDCVEIHYDERLLALAPPLPTCISDRENYSVWFKPSGLMSQGTRYGDFCSLVRQAELFFGNSRKVFPIHRLDRETAGIMIVAHDRRAAATLSELFRNHRIEKKYHAEVVGMPDRSGRNAVIDIPLDGRTAVTEFKVLAYDAGRNRSEVEIFPKTGRMHQIRRHFAMIGCPVAGDPKYGMRNKDARGLQLEAFSLRFTCPFSGREVEFSRQAVNGAGADCAGPAGLARMDGHEQVPEFLPLPSREPNELLYEK